MGRDMLRVKVFQVGGGEGEQSEEDFLLIIYLHLKYCFMYALMLLQLLNIQLGTRVTKQSCHSLMKSFGARNIAAYKRSELAHIGATTIFLERRESHK